MDYRRAFTALVVVACSRVPLVDAQTIRGQVLDEATSNAVGGAAVTLVDSLGRPVDTVVTDGDGRFVLEVGPGRFAFRVLRTGYAPTETTVLQVLSDANDMQVTIRVPSAGAVQGAFALTPIVVEGRPIPRYLAGFHQRRAEGFGDFVLREEFERWNPIHVSDVIRRMPSFVVRGNPTYGHELNGILDTRQYRIEVATRSRRRNIECPPVVFLDGAVLGDVRTLDVDLISVGMVEAMETYSRPAQIPAEFNRTGSDCGVIALWTRGPETGGATSGVELGLRYGGRFSNGGYGLGRLGFHLVTAFVGPVEFYPAFHLIVTAPSGRLGSATSGWHLQLAARVWPLGTRVPWFLGTGLALMKRTQELGSFGDNNDPEAAHTVFSGVAFRLGPLRPFAEVHALDALAFADLSIDVYSGLGVQF